MDTLFVLMTLTTLGGYSPGITGVQYSPPMKYEECAKAKQLSDRYDV